MDKIICVLQNKEDSVKEIQELRIKLSKEKFSTDEINKLAD